MKFRQIFHLFYKIFVNCIIGSTLYFNMKNQFHRFRVSKYVWFHIFVILVSIPGKIIKGANKIQWTIIIKQIPSRHSFVKQNPRVVVTEIKSVLYVMIVEDHKFILMMRISTSSFFLAWMWKRRNYENTKNVIYFHCFVPILIIML